MVFSSPVFLFLFLPLLLGFYALVPRSWRNVILLLFSLLFYAWGEGVFVGLMLASIGLNYGFGLGLEQAQNQQAKKIFLWVSVVANLGLLAYFKYFNLLADTALMLMGNSAEDTYSKVHLPIGISFFTFQAMSYIIDVYYGRLKAQRNPLDLALYISLFPQLIAGPIIRYHDVYRQIRQRVSTVPGIYEGSKRFILGLGKKLLLANPLGAVATDIFASDPGQLDAGLAWLGALCYTFQIYFDFSGYSDMAIGLGRILGFRFPENFNFPYISSSVREFWRRWHISLSSWFRDYLFIPMGGSRHGSWKTYRNLVLVFLLCGLWHGPSWTFLFWGAYHGLFLVIERVVRLRTVPVLGWVYTMLVVMVGWVFFNASSWSHAIQFLQAMAGMQEGPLETAFSASYYLDRERITVLLLAALGSMPWYDVVQKRISKQPFFAYLEPAFLIFILLICMFYLATDTYNPFLYFRF